jgi:adenylosuccinate synthase
MTEESGLTLLIEQHKKEVWEWKQKESKWLEDRVLLDGTKKLVNQLSEELTRMRKRAQEAEGENTIIKGIGNTSPEMKELQGRVKQLDNSLANALEINESHQIYNGKLQTRVTELEKDNKILSQQASDYIKKYEDSFRRAGI